MARGALYRRRVGLGAAVSLLMLVWLAIPGQAGPGHDGSAASEAGLHSEKDAAEESDEILGIAYSYSGIATAPGVEVDSDAYVQAFAEAADLPTVPGTWSELQDTNYNSDSEDYRDAFISNSGGGSGNVSGRMTGLAVADNGDVYAGAAGGGVWKSTDDGDTWDPIFDDAAASIAIGAIAINPDDDSIWVGTGENNTAFENHKGVGVFRSDNGGATWEQVGPNVTNSTIGDLEFDGAGNVYVATSRGLFSRSLSDPLSDPWALEFDATSFGFTPSPYGLSIVNDVEVQPGTDGDVVVANMAWRSGASYNGFYVSRDGGETWTAGKLSGAINPKEVGTASIDYSTDGSTLYTVIESTLLINKPNIQTGNTVLAGIYVSRTGDPDGPWNQIANYRKLQQSGSALKLSKGYAPGVQAWYNQFLGVDPADPDHVYVGLEEVFETRNGGTSWRAIGPYWNFTMPCANDGLDSCPKTTHPDQHVVAFGDGQVWVGNDGGIYSRDLDQDPSSPEGWHNHNADLRTLQYYGAGAGITPEEPGNPAIDPGVMVWGGMQDNGVSLLAPGLDEMVSPEGGDGGQQLVNPDNGDESIGEYVGLDMWLTTNGGYSPAEPPFDLGPLVYHEITPACGAFTYTPDPCDPLPRFIAPFTWDDADTDHMVAGGQYVWESTNGFDTRCSATACDWKRVFDTGAGRSVTALSVSGDTIYAGWCAPGTGCNPATSSTAGAGFSSGVATNAGGTWHQVTGALPNRYISAVAIDPTDETGMHVYAALGGFSRRWIDSAGVGQVFESEDGGATWTNISGNLPDAPARDLVLDQGGNLVLATDVGVFTAGPSGGSWSQLGSGLPHAVIDDLSFYPNGTTILAATHGRGLWSLALPA
ncbi:MAG TPA: glycosyl hydrolase [Actinomycetota bacterium]|nr:glycosyl hydrolase [Actinomycetota bacterium]